MGYKDTLLLMSIFFLTIIVNPTVTVMVKFGTNEGPIVPPEPSTTTTPSPNSYPAQPAPVYEAADDIPNPNVYKPLTPKQYRNKIYKYKPNPNLIFGTPFDRSYESSLQKYAFRKQKFTSSGLSYNGPQLFEPFEYKNVNNEKQQQQQQDDEAPVEQQRYTTVVSNPTVFVPQIGIVYSSGIRYYIPQFQYETTNEINDEGDDIDRGVHEANNLKHYYHNQNGKYYY